MCSTFPYGLDDPLWLCRAHYILARISSKCRCANCQREHDTRASNPRTAQATKPVSYSHAVIVIPFRILRKLIQRLIQDKEATLSALRIIYGTADRNRLAPDNSGDVLHTQNRTAHRLKGSKVYLESASGCAF